MNWQACVRFISLGVCTVWATWALAQLVEPPTPAAIPRLPVTTGWLGGTLHRGGGLEWGDRSQTWLENYTNDLAVSPDGFAYMTTPWEEGLRPAGIYKDGDALPEIPWFAPDSGLAVAVTDKHVVYGRHQQLVVFTRQPGQGVNVMSRREFSPQPVPGEITGVAVDETRGRIYFCDRATVRAVTLVDGKPVDYRIELERVEKLALDATGNLWVLQPERKLGRALQKGTPFGSEPETTAHGVEQILLRDDQASFVPKDTEHGYAGLSFDQPVRVSALRFVEGASGTHSTEVRWQAAYQPGHWTDLAYFADVTNGWPEEWLTLDATRPVYGVRIIGPNIRLHGLEVYTPTPAVPARILSYTPEGARLSREISILPHAVALAYDAHGDRLLVADGAPSHQVFAFTGLANTPHPDATFGAGSALGRPGGVFAGKPTEHGKVGPLRFDNIRGIGVDAAGNVYVASVGGQGTGQTRLECYTSVGVRRWNIEGLAFLDSAQTDPADPTTMYSCLNRFAVDWTKPAGTNWMWAASTLDLQTYPDDPRGNGGGALCYGVRRIGGQKFLITTPQGGDPLCVYRFDPPKAGEVAIPCVVFRTFNSGTAWPTHQPLGFGAFLWRDRNGDGQMQTDEYDKAVRAQLEFTMSPVQIDTAGNYWVINRAQGKKRLHCIRVGEKLDAHGVPVWAWNAPGNAIYDSPAPFDAPESSVSGFRVDAARGVVYLFGFTKDYPNKVGHNAPLGCVLARCRIDGGKLITTHVIRLPYDCDLTGTPHDQPYSASLAGNILFVGYEAHMTVLAYRVADLSLIGRLDIGEQGLGMLFDGPPELLAMQVPNGYALTMPQYNSNDIGVLTWSGATTGWLAAPTKLTAMRENNKVALAWTPGAPAAGWRIERRDLLTHGWEGWRQVAEIRQQATAWRDPAPPVGMCAYRLRAIGATGTLSDWSRTAYLRECGTGTPSVKH